MRPARLAAWISMRLGSDEVGEGGGFAAPAGHLCPASGKTCAYAYPPVGAGTCKRATPIRVGRELARTVAAR